MKVYTADRTTQMKIRIPTIASKKWNTVSSTGNIKITNNSAQVVTNGVLQKYTVKTQNAQWERYVDQNRRGTTSTHTSTRKNHTYTTKTSWNNNEHSYLETVHINVRSTCIPNHQNYTHSRHNTHQTQKFRHQKSRELSPNHLHTNLVQHYYWNNMQNNITTAHIFSLKNRKSAEKN